MWLKVAALAILCSWLASAQAPRVRCGVDPASCGRRPVLFNGMKLPFFAEAGQGFPILGGPPWLGLDRFDIVATWTADSVRRETRDLPGI